ncbi:hypothetical protein PN925_004203, partial [Morganella morganii]
EINFSKENKMKIIYIITSLGMGGAEKQACSLINEFSKEKNNEILIINLLSSKDIMNTPHDENIKIHSLSIKKIYPLLFHHYYMQKK